MCTHIQIRDMALYLSPIRQAAAPREYLAPYFPQTAAAASVSTSKKKEVF